MMDEKMINEILDKLVQEAGPIAIEEMEKEDLVNLDKPEFEFSEDSGGGIVVMKLKRLIAGRN